MSIPRPAAWAEPAIDPAVDVPRLPTFDELYESYFSFAWRTLRRLGVRAEDVADAAQDVFIVVDRRHLDLRSAEQARSWIYGIVVRVAHKYRRSQTRLARGEAQSEELRDERALSAHAAVERAEDVLLLDHLLGKLDLAKREVFVLVELEQMTAVEVAELTQAHLGTVYSRLRAARAEFEEALARHRATQRSLR
ncbi:MAG TPA: sigma-70 family RNA polymerase sigma factor [Polyangiaceae bacterium]|nr:sigma-70 family RNA polymerase sigma factor [Polyangiaceae bacterium]